MKNLEIKIICSENLNLIRIRKLGYFKKLYYEKSTFFYVCVYMCMCKNNGRQ